MPPPESNALASAAAPSRDARPTIHDAAAVESFRRRHRIDPDRIRRMRYALYRTYEPVAAALARIGEPHARQLCDHLRVEPLQVLQRHDSERDGSTKFVLHAGDQARLETVLLRAPSGRTAVCISTQVGCQAGCPFCATARMGLRRNLTAAEIVEQILLAGRTARTEGRRLRTIVFMGMGEPLDNEVELHAALDRLLDSAGFDLPPRRLLISTVGIPDAMRRLVDRYPGVQLAVSLHSARPELRAKLVPWSRRHSWDELREALRYVADRHATHRHQGPVMIEHLMLAGVNDRRDDAEALVAYLQGIRAHVNLIPYNPIPWGPSWQATPRSERDTFANVLREAGIFTTIRYSMGSDIQAACGQLVQAQGTPRP